MARRPLCLVLRARKKTGPSAGNHNVSHWIARGRSRGGRSRGGISIHFQIFFPTRGRRSFRQVEAAPSFLLRADAVSVAAPPHVVACCRRGDASCRQSRRPMSTKYKQGVAGAVLSSGKGNRTRVELFTRRPLKGAAILVLKPSLLFDLSARGARPSGPSSQVQSNLFFPDIICITPPSPPHPHNRVSPPVTWKLSCLDSPRSFSSLAAALRCVKHSKGKQSCGILPPIQSFASTHVVKFSTSLQWRHKKSHSYKTPLGPPPKKFFFLYCSSLRVTLTLSQRPC